MIVLLLAACSSSPTLTLDGPAELRVQRLGPVEAPKAALSTGEAPTGVVWASDAVSVAGVEGDQITAVGPGKATITGTWESQSVSWALVVEPPVTLVILEPPATIAVGATVPLKVTGRLSDGAIPVPDVSWSSNDASIAAVDSVGAVTGKATGTVYITATRGNSQAMVEIDIVGP